MVEFIVPHPGGVIVNLKDYFIAGGLAIACALIITFFLWIFSLIGWWIIGGLISFLLIPVFMKIVQFYHDTNCMDLSDFCIEVEDYFKEKQKKKKSSIDNNIEDIDW